MAFSEGSSVVDFELLGKEACRGNQFGITVLGAISDESRVMDALYYLLRGLL